MLCQIDSFPHVRCEAHDACEYKSYLVKLLCSFMDTVFTGSYSHTIVSESCISLHMTGHTGLSSKMETHNRCFHKGKLLTLVMSVQGTDITREISSWAHVPWKNTCNTRFQSEAGFAHTCNPSLESQIQPQKMWHWIRLARLFITVHTGNLEAAWTWTQTWIWESKFSHLHRESVLSFN